MWLVYARNLSILTCLAFGIHFFHSVSWSFPTSGQFMSWGKKCILSCTKCLELTGCHFIILVHMNRLGFKILWRSLSFSCIICAGARSNNMEVNLLGVHSQAMELLSIGDQTSFPLHCPFTDRHTLS